MAAPQEVLATGAMPVLMEDRVRRSVSSFDEGQLVYCVPARGYFDLRQEAPGYPNMRIHDIEEVDGPGDVIATLTCRGLMSGDSKVIGRQRRQGVFAFDMCDVEVVTRRPEIYTAGSALSGSASMFLVERGLEEMLDDLWWKLRLSYQGIESTKLRQRVVTVNEDIVSPSDPIVVNLPGGWDTATKGQVSFPSIVVTDTVVTRTAPPTNAIPGNAVPDNAPPVRVFGVFGTDLTRHWPNKWKLSDINSTELFLGAGVYHTSLSWKYQWEYTF
jgi:hypothetical protein